MGDYFRYAEFRGDFVHTGELGVDVRVRSARLIPKGTGDNFDGGKPSALVCMVVDGVEQEWVYVIESARRIR